MKSRLKELRLSRNLSQEEFGKRLGVTKSTISNIETGRFNLTDSMVMLACKEFNVNEHWLRTGEGNPEPEISEADAYRRAADILGAGEHEMDRIVRGIIMKYGDMDKTSKDVFLKYLKDLASSVLESNMPAKEDSPDDYARGIYSSVPDEDPILQQYKKSTGNAI